MHNSVRKRKQPKFLGATVTIIGLAVINLIIIYLNDTLHSDSLTFFGNTIGIGLLFPAGLLYIDRKEKFNWKRYLYFVIATSFAIGIIMYLFVQKF